jgi:hypothetical protein
MGVLRLGERGILWISVSRASTKRPVFLLLLLCALLAVAAAAPGLSPTALIALLGAAAGLGALTAAAIGRMRLRSEPAAAAQLPHAPEPPSPAKRPHTPKPTRALPPARPRPAPALLWAASERLAAQPHPVETCTIKLHDRHVNAHFFAILCDGGPVLARSPPFRIRADGDPGLGAPDALRALVEQLTAAGWRQTGAGRTPWDLRFERRAAGYRPASDPGAVRSSL